MKPPQKPSTVAIIWFIVTFAFVIGINQPDQMKQTMNNGISAENAFSSSLTNLLTPAILIGLFIAFIMYNRQKSKIKKQNDINN